MVNFLLYIIIDLNHIIMFVSFYSQCSTLTFYVLCKNVWWHYVVRSPIRSFRVGHLERISSDLATFARCLANSLHTLRCDHSVQLMLPAPLICAGPNGSHLAFRLVSYTLHPQVCLRMCVRIEQRTASCVYWPVAATQGENDSLEYSYNFNFTQKITYSIPSSCSADSILWVWTDS